MTRRHRSQIVLALLAASAVGIIVALLVAATPAHAANGLNACGCREGAPGQCICEKKSRCGCPGECEPKGCEEKRAKQLEKEIQAETRKAEEAQRRQRVRQEEPEEDSPPRGGREPAEQNRTVERPAPKVKIVKMTPAQKRDLAKLLEVYVAEHPEGKSQTAEEIKRNLAK